MGIQVLIKEGESRPVIFCDHCKNQIEESRGGVVVYPEYEYTEGLVFPPSFAHRKSCHDALEKKIGNGGWQPLDLFLGWMLNNVKYKSNTPGV